jgi:hypothetical protein
MLMLRFAVALLLAAVPATALQAMPVSQFLTKADALEKKGAMALFSSDIKLLKKEVTDAAAQLREERATAQRAGRKPAYCPPAGKGSLDSKELLAYLRSIPPARRGMQVRDGLRGLFARKYPCPA